VENSGIVPKTEKEIEIEETHLGPNLECLRHLKPLPHFFWDSADLQYII
jgi:hypothetical protein